MDISHIISHLNDAQRKAVSCDPEHTLVLAGAGSGKTRVLVHRIAWLVQALGVSTWDVLAVTFTNKAAKEMRQRIGSLLELSVGGMWVGTFHGLAHRLLRAHWEEAGLPQSFQILDSDDQFRMIKRLMKALEIDDKIFPARQVQGFINKQKDKGLRPQHIEDNGDFHLRKNLLIYQEYENACKRAGVVDFGELLLRAHEVLRDNAELLAHYQTRFKHILVDEFQDTNAIQYAWLRLLAGDNNFLFVVGDDDQSIYGWRGAKVENIQQFQQHYTKSQLIILEQNYRSTGHILKASNQLISRNVERLGKELWTDAGEGEKITLYSAFNETDEARYVIGVMEELFEKDVKRDDVAVLYRSNAQSRLFEEALISSQIPYRVYGGLRFFDRAEIKDALAYLRLLSNPHDDTAFERSVNMPPRGIGARTVDLVRVNAREKSLSMWQASHTMLQDSVFTARAGNALKGFLDLINMLSKDMKDEALHEIVDRVIGASTLKTYFLKSKDGKGPDRVENLDELVSATRDFTFSGEDEMDDLSSFLAHAALEAGENQADESEACVQLMTMHSAKGLEFPYVFIGGLEDGLFPHKMTMDDPSDLEEERRLCYVGMTRAKEKLYLSYAESRRLHGKVEKSLPSRFIRELPKDCLQEVRVKSAVTRPVFTKSNMFIEDSMPFRISQRVTHAKFGDGMIINIEGNGATARVQVNFEFEGSKWLMLSYANLQPL